MISVLILTLNEEINLPACLKSVNWSDDVVVFDSFSTDGTAEIAKKNGARFVQRAFDNYASQRNAALMDITYKHPWLFMVDADEQVTPELAAEISEAVKHAVPEVALFRMRRKDMYLGRWLRRSSGYPTWFGRLMRIGRVRVERQINEEYLTDGQVTSLQGHLVHHPFSKGIDDWVERHNRYSSMEAQVLARELLRPLVIRNFFSPDPVLRRRALKQLAYRLPGRPLLVFSYLYMFRIGFLDGKAGLRFALLRSFYEFLIEAKASELRRRGDGLPP